MRAWAALASLTIASTASGQTPTFGEPRVATASATCPHAFTASRSPDNSVLSILRTATSTSEKNFLDAYSNRLSDAADCTVDVVFERPLATIRTLSLDVRGAEFKTPRSRGDYTIAIGTQRHRYAYGLGSWLEGGAATEFRRFAITLPKGARSVRIRLIGSAQLLDPTAQVQIAFDAIDLCFIDPDHPEFCGVPGQPNKRAGQ